MALQLLSWLEAMLLLARPSRLLGALSLQNRTQADFQKWREHQGLDR
jgi:hypothetical protein